MNAIPELQARFGIPGVVEVRPGVNGLPLVAVTSPLAEAHVYLQGAHVTHYQARGQAPLLFMSAASHFAPGSPIRGGVPVCFPWFGPSKTDPQAPAHGFARTAAWTLRDVTRTPDEEVTISLALLADDQTRRAWPHAFELLFRVAVGSSLVMSLELRNTDDKPFTVEEALHTYLAVDDVRNVSIEGLGGRTYLDKTQNMARHMQESRELRIAGETDRHYLGTRDTVVVNDPGASRRIVVAKEGSDVTVVWNPWIAKAKAMSDFGDEEWTKMLCIETANAHDLPVTLPAGASHVMRARIHAE